MHATYFPQPEEAPVAQSPLADLPALVIPGWNGSGAGHWQTLWERKYGRFRRVQQQNWSRPTPEEWVAEIDAEFNRSNGPMWLVAHSLGCVAVAHWAAVEPEKAEHVAGAFLVAPPWLTASDHCPAALAAFLPMPTARLPFPSLFVASENDPYLPIELAARLATAWGSQFVDVGRKGHINVASGHGPWVEGEGLLRGFVSTAC